MLQKCQSTLSTRNSKVVTPDPNFAANIVYNQETAKKLAMMAARGTLETTNSKVGDRVKFKTT